MKMKSAWKKRAILIVIVLLLPAAGTVGLAAGEGLLLWQAAEAALRHNPLTRLARVRVELAKVGAEQLRQRVDGAVYRLMSGATLSMEEWSLVYVGPGQAEQMEPLALRRERAERDLLVLETQRNYLEVYRATDRLKLAELALSRAREQQRLAEVAFSAGTVARSDILAAQAQVAAAEARVYAAESSVQSARAALNKSLDRPLAAKMDLPAVIGAPERGTLNLQLGLSEAESSRLEVIAAGKAVRLKERERDFARHTLDSVGRRKAELAVEEAQLQLETTLAAVRLEVFQLYHRLSGLELQLAALEEGVRFAGEAHRLALLRYQAGVGTSQEITSARDALTEREQELLHARYEGYLGYLSWLLATGRRLEQTLR
jgi:outer membrane protein TolC